MRSLHAFLDFCPLSSQCNALDGTCASRCVEEAHDVRRRKVDIGQSVRRELGFAIGVVGSAGCVLADRLGDNGVLRVLLLEGGGTNKLSFRICQSGPVGGSSIRDLIGAN